MSNVGVRVMRPVLVDRRVPTAGPNPSSPSLLSTVPPTNHHHSHPPNLLPIYQKVVEPPDLLQRQPSRHAHWYQPLR